VRTKTITLTATAPVTINEDAWPVIADASDCDRRSIPSEANRTWTLSVRQHADGRSIVYGVGRSVFADENDRRGGQIVPAGGDVPEAIFTVAESLGFERHLADKCIADLPPVVLDDDPDDDTTTADTR